MGGGEWPWVAKERLLSWMLDNRRLRSPAPESWNLGRVRVHSSFIRGFTYCPGTPAGTRSRKYQNKAPLAQSAQRTARSMRQISGLLCRVVGSARSRRGLGEDGARHSQELNAQGPSKGEVLRQINATLVHLPPPDTKRWTARRKASVVAAVLSGIITIEEVCQRYGLSVDEFLSWHNAMQRHGLEGLRITKLQNYRYSRPKRD